MTTLTSATEESISTLYRVGSSSGTLVVRWETTEDKLTLHTATSGSGGQGDELALALQELDGAVEEAHTEGLAPPSYVALENARLLLNGMYAISPRLYSVYPTDDGEVVIDGGKYGRSVFVHCLPDGGVQYIGWAQSERHSEIVARGKDLIAENGEIVAQPLIQILNELDQPPVT